MSERKGPVYEASPHQAARKERLERLRKFIVEEGSEVSDARIAERFPWARNQIKKIRVELGIPSPGGSEYLTPEDFRDRKMVPEIPLKGRSGSKWRANVEAAKERAKQYEEE